MATSLADQIPDGAAVGIDTNVFIYYFESHPEYLAVVEPLFARINEGTAVAHVSAITLTEVLLKPLRVGRDDLAAQYRAHLSEGKNVVLHDLEADLADQAGVLGARYGLRTPDAIVCATALNAACAFIVTNDGKFDRVEGITTLRVKDYL